MRLEIIPVVPPIEGSCLAPGPQYGESWKRGFDGITGLLKLRLVVMNGRNLFGEKMEKKIITRHVLLKEDGGFYFEHQCPVNMPDRLPFPCREVEIPCMERAEIPFTHCGKTPAGMFIGLTDTGSSLFFYYTCPAIAHSFGLRRFDGLFIVSD